MAKRKRKPPNPEHIAPVVDRVMAGLAEEAHHPFGGSSLLRRALCPGSSAQEQAAPPGKSSDAADRGSRCHLGVSGEIALDEFDAEEREQVQRCIAFREELADASCDVHNEVKLNLYDGKTQLNYSTVDCVILPRGSSEVVIVDWKFYRGPLSQRGVSVQLYSYLAAAMQTYGRTEGVAWAYNPIDGAKIKIVCTELAEAIGYVRRVIDASLAPDAPLSPGIDQCQYCRALATCPAAATLTEETAPAVLEEASKLPVKPADLARALDMGALCVKRYDELRRMAHEFALAGEEIPGWKIVSRKGSSRITDSVAAISLLSAYVPERRITEILDLSYSRAKKLFIETTLKNGEFPDRESAAAEFAIELGGITEEKPSISYLRRSGNSSKKEER